MSICVAYTVVSGGKQTSDYVSRFCSTWCLFLPGIPCDVVAVCNGGRPSVEQEAMLSSIGAKMFVNSNEGWDLGGYFRASKGPLYNYSNVLYLGQSVHFYRAGWLKRMADEQAKWGHGFYGPFATHVKSAHIQMTSFMTCPRLFIQYPLSLKTKEDRYACEHGDRALWRMIHRRGYSVRLVTWDGSYAPGQWRLPANVLWKGDQSNLLWYANHSDNWAKLPQQRKLNWQRSADRPYA